MNCRCRKRRRPRPRATVERLGEAAAAELARQGVADERVRRVARAHLKYEGTDSSLAVEFGPADAMRAAFEAAYRSRFSFLMPGEIAATLCIMVGGDRALFEQCRPLFEKLGNQVYYAGPLGAGHAIKALNNYVSAAGLVAACEAVIAGQSFGLDPGVIVDILNASSGMNNTTRNKVKQYMLSGAFNAGFTTG